MVMEDVVKIDPGNLSVSMAMGDVVETDPGNLIINITRKLKGLIHKSCTIKVMTDIVCMLSNNRP